jgi:hypothetical protein
MLFKGTHPVYPENRKRHVHIVCGQTADILNIKAGFLKGYIRCL